MLCVGNFPQNTVRAAPEVREQGLQTTVKGPSCGGPGGTGWGHMPGLQVPARGWGWGPCLWRPDSTGTPAAHPEHLPRHHGGSHSRRSTATPQGQWAQGPGKSGVTRGLLPGRSHRWNTNKKNNSWYLPRSTLCAGKRAECFQHNTPFCPPSTWGIGALIMPILKIKKLRPEVTGAGHEVRQVALTEDALLPPLGELRGCGRAAGGCISVSTWLMRHREHLGGPVGLGGTPHFLQPSHSPQKEALNNRPTLQVAASVPPAPMKAG